MKYEIVTTPHNTKRLFVDKAIHTERCSVNMLDWLSIWGGADKVEEKWDGYLDGIVSWEFSLDVPDRLIEKAITRPLNTENRGSVY